MFGMCDTSEEPALGYMELVDSRDAATLLPICRYLKPIDGLLDP